MSKELPTDTLSRIEREAIEKYPNDEKASVDNNYINSCRRNAYISCAKEYEAKLIDLEEINAALLRSKLKFNDTVMAYEEKVSKLREALDKILGSMSLERVERFDLKTLAEQTLKETE